MTRPAESLLSVRIESVAVEVSDREGRSDVRYVPRSREMSESELAQRPPEYPLIVETAVALLALARRALPLVCAGATGHLDRAQLVDLLRTVLDRVVLDENWAQHTRESLQLGRVCKS